MDKLKLIKTVVFILTFLLVFSTVYLLGKFAKMADKEENIPESIILNEPEGSYIKSIKSSDKNLYLHIISGGQGDRILVLDSTNLQTITKIYLNERDVK